MVGQVPLEESNIALINSDLAKEVRAKAAEFEPEWSGAGEKEGIEIWRSENLGIKRWPADDTGKFFDGDSYIGEARPLFLVISLCLFLTLIPCGAPGASLASGGSVLNTYKREDKILYNVHFWLGANTSQDEAGVAA
jgi:gelsolin